MFRSVCFALARFTRCVGVCPIPSGTGTPNPGRRVTKSAAPARDSKALGMAGLPRDAFQIERRRPMKKKGKKKC